MLPHIPTNRTVQTVHLYGQSTTCTVLYTHCLLPSYLEPSRMRDVWSDISDAWDTEAFRPMGIKLKNCFCNYAYGVLLNNCKTSSIRMWQTLYWHILLCIFRNQYSPHPRLSGTNQNHPCYYLNINSFLDWLSSLF